MQITTTYSTRCSLVPKIRTANVTAIRQFGSCSGDPMPGEGQVAPFEPPTIIRERPDPSVSRGVRHVTQHTTSASERPLQPDTR